MVLTSRNIERIMSPNSGDTATHTRKKRRLDLDSFDDIVDIFVGPSRHHFQMHKDLLCNVSTYFPAALNGYLKEAQEQKIEFLEDSVEVFKYFRYWLYSQTLLMTTEAENDIEWRTLIDIFIFGDMRSIPRLQNAAIDGMIEKQATDAHNPLEEVRYIYENTIEKSPLRSLFVNFTHTIVHFNHRDWADGWLIEEKYELFPKRFLFDVAVAYCRKVSHLAGGIGSFKDNRWRYHVKY
ncbi:hypothetical protein N7G274_005768 [Stereocaulon virgatum]|uniref:BTB domain-containing protein n=1 Tax=Stereocaulon virgatum TaxID=373712 RepID=A0ABR4A900_9LECA